MNNWINDRISLISKILTKGLWHSNATVLMYHRVADLKHDPWLVGVSPENFEEQVQVMREYPVISMQQFVNNLKEGKLSRSIVITFDDGYKDNFYNAVPVLAKAGLPATFFIASGYTGRQKQFWANDLDSIFLTPGTLPERLEINTKQIQFSYNLGEDNFLSEDPIKQFQNWIAWESSPTKRHSLYVEVARLIKSLPPEQEDELLEILYQWSGKKKMIDSANLMMNENELKELATNSLFEIGGHTVSHPELSAFPIDIQLDEIRENIHFLETVINRPIQGMAYPYGAYNKETIQAVKMAGLQYACTTQQKPTYKNESLYTLPRLRVRNWNGVAFKKRINRLLQLGV